MCANSYKFDVSFFFKCQIYAEVEDVLQRVADSGLFRNVGQFDDQASVLQIESWSEAIERIETLEWENYCLEHKNHLTESLFLKERAIFQGWNKVVRAIKPKMITAIGAQVEALRKANELPKVFLDTVEWDILTALLEEQYSQYVPRYFYTDMLQWYLKGYFPCGYDGDYPNGRFIVY